MCRTWLLLGCFGGLLQVGSGRVLCYQVEFVFAPEYTRTYAHKLALQLLVYGFEAELGAQDLTRIRMQQQQQQQQ